MRVNATQGGAVLILAPVMLFAVLLPVLRAGRRGPGAGVPYPDMTTRPSDY